MLQKLLQQSTLFEFVLGSFSSRCKFRSFDWSNQLAPRNPEDFVRLFTDEVVEEALENINDINNPVNIDIVAVDDVEEYDDEEDDVFTPVKSRLTRRGAFRSKERSYANSRVEVREPVRLTTPLLPDLVDPDQAQYLDLAIAALPLDVLEVDPLALGDEESPQILETRRRSSRLSKPNPRFLGNEWE